MPTRRPSSWLGYPQLTSLLPCACQREATAGRNRKRAETFHIVSQFVGGTRLTPCLGSLSTCQRWCWRSLLHAASSRLCRLRERTWGGHVENLRVLTQVFVSLAHFHNKTNVCHACQISKICNYSSTLQLHSTLSWSVTLRAGTINRINWGKLIFEISVN